MLKSDKQNQKWNSIDVSTKEGQEFKQWISDVGKDYIKERNNRSFFTKLFMFIFGDINVIGANIINDYGEQNILKS
ncbi:MAG: hypothetical protein NC548_40545 [Lachnospiraceae bacterium]|nr:hypothetical protein [Lachnospiraceae bacterium]